MLSGTHTPPSVSPAVSLSVSFRHSCQSRCTLHTGVKLGSGTCTNQPPPTKKWTRGPTMCLSPFPALPPSQFRRLYLAVCLFIPLPKVGGCSGRKSRRRPARRPAPASPPGGSPSPRRCMPLPPHCPPGRPMGWGRGWGTVVTIASC